jgi:hypothetical protein
MNEKNIVFAVRLEKTGMYVLIFKDDFDDTIKQYFSTLEKLTNEIILHIKLETGHYEKKH